MRKTKTLFVAISAAALNFLSAGTARCQVTIDCPQDFRVGEHVACDDGSFTINPNGVNNLDSGCLVTLTPPQVAQCILGTGGVPPAGNVTVDVVQTRVFLNNGGAQVTVEDFLIGEDGEPTFAPKLIFTPTEVAGGVTVNIGGQLLFNNGQAIGNYVGSVQITAEE